MWFLGCAAFSHETRVRNGVVTQSYALNPQSPSKVRKARPGGGELHVHTLARAFRRDCCYKLTASCWTTVGSTLCGKPTPSMGSSQCLGVDFCPSQQKRYPELRWKGTFLIIYWTEKGKVLSLVNKIIWFLEEQPSRNGGKKNPSGLSEMYRQTEVFIIIIGSLKNSPLCSHVPSFSSLLRLRLA